MRRFSAGSGPAWLLITGLGLYEAYLNGTRVGDWHLTPGFSYLRFQTDDVTELLRDENELRVVLADGWYKGRMGLRGRTNTMETGICSPPH